jgi:hypothetical protein
MQTTKNHFRLARQPDSQAFGFTGTYANKRYVDTTLAGITGHSPVVYYRYDKKYPVGADETAKNTHVAKHNQKDTWKIFFSLFRSLIKNTGFSRDIQTPDAHVVSFFHSLHSVYFLDIRSDTNCFRFS